MNKRQRRIIKFNRHYITLHFLYSLTPFSALFLLLPPHRRRENQYHSSPLGLGFRFPPNPIAQQQQRDGRQFVVIGGINPRSRRADIAAHAMQATLRTPGFHSPRSSRSASFWFGIYLDLNLFIA